MQERQVSVEGTTRPLPAPFHVLATANPIEHEGTYPLPEAQLDRFLLRLSFGYPTSVQEWEVVSRRLDRRREEQRVAEVLDGPGLLGVQAVVEEVHVEDSVGHYAVDLVSATREHQHALVGASPRGTLALITCARALAVVRGRTYVVPEDVKALAHAALDHRVTVSQLGCRTRPARAWSVGLSRSRCRMRSARQRWRERAEGAGAPTGERVRPVRMRQPPVPAAIVGCGAFAWPSC